MSSAVFKNTNLVLPGIYLFCVLYTFLANSSCVMLVVVAGLLDQTNVTVLYFYLYCCLLFICLRLLNHITLLLLLFNLFKSKNCLVKAPMLIAGSFSFDS